jgi:ankyrin repeat protein
MPLHFAALANNLENIKILLRNKANVNAKDSLGNTAMHYAVKN